MNYKPFARFWPFVLALFLVTCDNHIIQRTAGDFLPYRPGNWWRYHNASAYDPQTVFIEVEPAETLLNVECYPVTTSGIAAYLAIDDAGIREYVKTLYTYAGVEYTVAEGFVLRLAAPLVAGSRFADSLVDSVLVGGAWIKARYAVTGLVSDYQADDLYGTVYPVYLTIRDNLITPDSAINRVSAITEYYAPEIGLVRFENETGDFRLSEYSVQ